MSQATYTYTEIIERRERAIRVQIDGHSIWLPLKGCEIDEEARTISHSLIPEKLAAAARGDRRVDLGAPDWESAKSFGFDVFAAPMGDRTSGIRVRVFAPKSQVTEDGVPMWLIDRAVADSCGGLRTSFDVTTGEGEPIASYRR